MKRIPLLLSSCALLSLTLPALAADQDATVKFREAIMKLRLFQMITTRLMAARDGRIDADSVLEELGTLLPYDHPAKLLETLIAWGRYAELIDFDQNANVVYLHEASEADDEEEVPPSQ